MPGKNLGWILFVGFLTIVLGPAVLPGVRSYQVSAAQSASVPIRVESIQSVPDKKRITFVLQNTGTKAITAWQAAIKVGTGEGAAIGGHGVDAYQSFAGVGPGASFMLPGGSTSANVAMPSGANPNDSQIEITPTAVVFADLSFAGDREFADFILQRRAEERDTLQALLNDLDEAARSGGTVASLEQLRSRLDTALASKPFDPVRAQLVRPALVTAIGDIKQGRSSPDTILKFLQEKLQQNLTAARAHSRQ